MAFAERFEDLEIWQLARLQVVAIYRAFDKCRDYPFRDQIQRASISVMNNVAEGFERHTKADFAHFLDHAKGSCGEVRSMTYAAEDLRFLSPEAASRLRADAETLSQKIAAFTRHLRK